MGWFTAKTNGIQATPMTKVTDDITFYAKWKVNVYTVSFVTNVEGYDVPDRKVEWRGFVGELPSKEDMAQRRPGYDFVEWQDEYGNEVIQTTQVLEDLVVYARWKKKTYTIEYSLKEQELAHQGTVVARGIVKYGEDGEVQYNQPFPKTYQTGDTIYIGEPGGHYGYDFGGWLVNGIVPEQVNAPDGSPIWKIIAPTDYTNKLVEVKSWNVKECRVRFIRNWKDDGEPQDDEEDPTIVENRKVNYWSEVGELPTPNIAHTPPGKRFAGWYTARVDGT